jgi:hypothetical protein
MSGLDNSQIITDEVSLHAEEAGLAGHKQREHVSPLGTAPAGHLPEEAGATEEKAEPAAQ